MRSALLSAEIARLTQDCCAGPFRLKAQRGPLPDFRRGFGGPLAKAGRDVVFLESPLRAQNEPTADIRSGYMQRERMTRG
jgi:hypothetical protein